MASIFGTETGNRVMKATKIEILYKELIDAWNRCDAFKFSSLFLDDATCIGFDGSDMKGKEVIYSQLSKIFSDHDTARYVTIVREINGFRLM